MRERERERGVGPAGPDAFSTAMFHMRNLCQSLCEVFSALCLYLSVRPGLSLCVMFWLSVSHSG